MDKSIYQFNVQQLNGEELSLSEYKDKVLLIVNTASQCGFTPQLKELAQLRKDFPGNDFEILAFPSNDFGGQEPLEGKGIAVGIAAARPADQIGLEIAGIGGLQ